MELKVSPDFNSSYKTVNASISFGLGALLLFFVVQYKFKKPNFQLSKKDAFDINSLPGPKVSAIPFVGNALELLPIKNVIPTCSKWSQKYGPIFRVQVGPEKLVWLNSPEMAEFLLKSHELGHNTRPEKFFDEYKPFINTGLLVSKGKFWKGQRKIMMRSMSLKSLKSYMPLLMRHSERLVTGFSKLFADDGHHEVTEIIDLILFEAVCEMVTGIDLHGTQDGIVFRHGLHTAKQNFLDRMHYPWLRIQFFSWLFSKSEKVNKAYTDWRNIIKNLISNHKEMREKHLGQNKTLNDTTTANCLSSKCLLDELVAENMADEQIIEELIMMITAGHDTTSVVLMFLCFHMAANPSSQAKCHQEIDTMWNTESQGLTFESLDKLVYLEQCVLETLRLTPPAFFYFRKLESPLAVGEKMVLPTGTNVVVNALTLHWNQEYFPDPKTFDPDRFTPEETAKRHKYAFIPFSAGPRNCIGFKFAMMELKVAAAHILRHFTLTTTDAFASVPLTIDLFLIPERNYLFQFKSRK